MARVYHTRVRAEVHARAHTHTHTHTPTYVGFQWRASDCEPSSSASCCRSSTQINIQNFKEIAIIEPNLLEQTVPCKGSNAQPGPAHVRERLPARLRDARPPCSSVSDCRSCSICITLTFSCKPLQLSAVLSSKIMDLSYLETKLGKTSGQNQALSLASLSPSTLEAPAAAPDAAAARNICCWSLKRLTNHVKLVLTATLEAPSTGYTDISTTSTLDWNGLGV